MTQTKEIAICFAGYAALFLAVFLMSSVHISQVWLTIFLGLSLTLVSAIDHVTQRIPNLLNVALFGVGAFTQSNNVNFWLHHVIGAFITLAILILIALVFQRARGKQGLGGGDIKLCFAATIWIGFPQFVFMLFVASTLAVLGATSLIILRRSQLQQRTAFGPYLAFGMFVVWCFGAAAR